MSQKANRREFIKQTAAATAALSLGSLGLGCGDESEVMLGDGFMPDLGPLDGSLDGPPVEHPDGHLDGPPGEMDGDALVDAGAPATRPTTTVRQRIQGVLPSEQQPVSEKKQWGVTHTVAGDLHLRTDLLQVDAIAGTPTGSPASLLFAAQVTDVHINDEESPARTINLDQITSPSWRLQEAHNALVLDAMVRKLKQFDGFRKLDCVLITGDSIENNQRNELQWALQVLEGGQVQPNSGDLEDPDPGPENDPHDAFTAEGMGSIPWYMAIGNHDSLIQGNLPHGLLLDYSLVTGDPTRDHIGALELGRVNPPTCNPIPPAESPTPDRCIPNYPNQLSDGSLPKDLDRVHLSKGDWFDMVRKAGGLPAGHGFSSDHVSSGKGDYTVDPVPGLPLRLIVLDTTAPAVAVGYYTRIDSFLKPALDKAQQDQMLVIVATHHDTGGMPLHSNQLISTLKSYPNVILHLVGHGHQNKVTAHKGATPLNSYWEVQTCAMVDWPQQARLFELVDNRDGTVEIWLTLVDYEVDHQPMGPVAAGSRFLSLYEVHSGAQGGGKSGEGAVQDRNVILPVAIPFEVRKKLAAIPGEHIESELF